jgi:hypothetical protein
VRSVLVDEYSICGAGDNNRPRTSRIIDPHQSWQL